MVHQLMMDLVSILSGFQFQRLLSVTVDCILVCMLTLFELPALGLFLKKYVCEDVLHS